MSLDVVQLIEVAAGFGTLGVGLLMQRQTHALRRLWASGGMGLEERATGLASLTAIPAIFPTELHTAASCDHDVAVIVMRRYEEHPEAFGRRLAAATRAHETAWRLDYDVFAVTATVRSDDEAVMAAARLGRAACGNESSRDLRIGLAMCPLDGVDLIDVSDMALRRLRSLDVLEAIAEQLALQRQRVA